MSPRSMVATSGKYSFKLDKFVELAWLLSACFSQDPVARLGIIPQLRVAKLDLSYFNCLDFK